MTPLTCRDVVERVDAVAAGDIEADDALRDHLETCPRCASALAAARRLELALAAIPAPPAPAQFTANVLSRVRRERWQSEQNVDRLFNVAVIAASILIGGGLFALLNLGGVMSAARMGWALLSTAGVQGLEYVAPAAVTYVAAAGLLASALGMWWWAERRLSL